MFSDAQGRSFVIGVQENPSDAYSGEPCPETPPGNGTEPTDEPTDERTVEPTDVPTVGPTDEPTVGPTVGPTDEPTVEPTEEPTEEPTDEPTGTQPSAPSGPISAPTDLPATQLTGIVGLFAAALALLAAAYTLRGTRQH